MFAPRHLMRQVPGAIAPQATPRNTRPSRGLFGEKYIRIEPGYEVDYLQPGDIFDYTLYDMLAEAPEPPDGLDEMVAMLKEAEAARKS